MIEQDARPRPPASEPNRPSPYAHLEPLIVELATTADDARRRWLQTQLIAGYLPVVRNIASRYARRGEPIGDIEQAGSIGLLQALRRFDPTRGADFLSYAIPTITGEIRKHFRDHTWAMRVPRRYKDLQGPVRSAVADLSARLGRAPRPSEIATAIGEPVEDVIETLNARQAYAPDSLDSASAGTEQPALGDTLGQIDPTLDTVEYRESLQRALDALPERERTIVLLRFYGDQTQTQIAERVGISQMHVSRLLTQTLEVLRRTLAAD